MTVFFDLDRTLMDFEKGEDMGIKAIFETYKSQLKMDYESFRSTWKVVAQKTFDEYSAGKLSFDQQRRLRVVRMFEENSIKLDEEEAAKRFELYWSTYAQGVENFPDTLSILENLKVKNVQIGLISNGDSKNQRWKLDKGKISHFFDPIIVSDEIGVSKPDLKVFEIALEKAGACKEDSWYIGDSPLHDIEPALKFGLNVIYLNRKLGEGSLLHHQEKPAYIEVQSLDLAWQALSKLL
ncbi:MAG: HAD family hydrolase [Treponema sp.]|nr:HAD family hydrolase [Treponema sp.]